VTSETILIIDEPREALAVGTLFAPTPYSILTAHRAEQALQILESEHPVDLVLSEAVLPDTSGAAFLVKVRVRYPGTAVMLMTSVPDRSIDSAIPVAIKPLTAAVIERVETLLAATRAQTKAYRAAVQLNRTARADLDAARQTLTGTVERSRRRRCDQFCARLREPGAHIPTILVAENDPVLRYAVTRFLARCGFHVLDAADGADALRISREYSGAIELLLTDLDMPGLDGLALAPALEAERPGVRILVMTGADLSLPRETLRKPFELEDLLAGIVGLIVRR